MSSFVQISVHTHVFSVIWFGHKQKPLWHLFDCSCCLNNIATDWCISLVEIFLHRDGTCANLPIFWISKTSLAPCAILVRLCNTSGVNWDEKEEEEEADDDHDDDEEEEEEENDDDYAIQSLPGQLWAPPPHLVIRWRIIRLAAVCSREGKSGGGHECANDKYFTMRTMHAQRTARIVRVRAECLLINPRRAWENSRRFTENHSRWLSRPPTQHCAFLD